MRSLRKSWIGIVLIFFFGISLFFWKQSTVVSNIFNSDTVIAKVGDTKISTTRFNRGLQLNIKQFNDILGKELTGEEIKNYQIHQLALSGIINETIFENEFNNLNLKLDEKIIARKTKALIPQLYNENNELNEIYLKEFLSQQKLKIEDIVQILHYEARKEYYDTTLLDFYLPESFSKKIHAFDNHDRNIQYIKFPIEKINIDQILEKNESKLDNILLEFYNENLSDYMTNEKRKILYIKVNKNDYLNNFIPTNQEALKYYNDNTSLYLENEKRSFVQFNFKKLEDAENFKKNIGNLINYEEIINYSDSRGIEYNYFEELENDEVLEKISKSLFFLSINEISSIIKSPIAFHVIVLKEILDKKQLKFEEVKEIIIDEISNIDVNNFLIDLESQISQDILDGLDLKQISNKNNLNLSLIENFSQDFNKFDEESKIFYDSILENAFNAQLNFTNDIVKLNNNEFYTFEIDEIVKSKPMNFNDIKLDVLENWKKFKKLESIDKKIANNQINNNFFIDLENEFKEKSLYLNINLSSTNIPKKLNDYIFNSNINDINYIIEEDMIHLSKLIEVNIENRMIDNYNEKTHLNNQIRNSVYNELIKTTKISTNDKLINAILDRY